jgi:hypothetical protein
MKTNTQLAALVAASDASIAAAFNGKYDNVDHKDIRPILQNLLDNEQAFLENEFSIVPTFLDNADGTGTLTLQVKDGNGNNVTSAVELEIGISATPGTIYVSRGAVTAATGTVTFIGLAGAFLRVRTTAAGLAVLTLGTSNAKSYRALVVGSSQANALEGTVTVTG